MTGLVAFYVQTEEVIKQLELDQGPCGEISAHFVAAGAIGIAASTFRLKHQIGMHGRCCCALCFSVGHTRDAVAGEQTDPALN